MNEEQFWERLRQDARELQFQPDAVMVTRMEARIRARVIPLAQPTVPQLLARWFRPLAASLSAIALAATLGLAWVGTSPATDSQPAESLSTPATVEISMGGDVYRVGE
jgi:hypothetical protein